jgi:hypothetical protein
MRAAGGDFAAATGGEGNGTWYRRLHRWPPNELRSLQPDEISPRVEKLLPASRQKAWRRLRAPAGHALFSAVAFEVVTSDITRRISGGDQPRRQCALLGGFGRLCYLLLSELHRFAPARNRVVAALCAGETRLNASTRLSRRFRACTFRPRHCASL